MSKHKFSIPYAHHQKGLDRYNAAWQFEAVKLAYKVLQLESLRHFKTGQGACNFNVFCQDAAIAWCADPPFYRLHFYRRLMSRTVHDYRLRYAAQSFVRLVGDYGKPLPF